METPEVLGRKIAARPVNLPTCQHVATNFFSLCSLETIRRLFKYRLATIGIVLVYNANWCWRKYVRCPISQSARNARK